MDYKPLQIQFTACYEAHVDALLRFCLVRVSDREQAMDITQETFTRLWQSMMANQEIHNERAFVFTIAHNVIIDWYRKKKAVSLEALAELNDTEHETPYEPKDDKVFNDLEMEAEGRHLLEKIREVHDANRQAVYLRFVEGMTPPEIGAILHISANAASVRVNRGLRELRQLTGYDGRDEIGR